MSFDPGHRSIIFWEIYVRETELHAQCFLWDEMAKFNTDQLIQFYVYAQSIFCDHESLKYLYLSLIKVL